MIPSLRCYVLLGIGGVGAALLDTLVNRQISLGFLGSYNLLLAIATIADAAGVKANAIEVTRLEINRLSVGRDNPIELKIRS